ncbi:MAG TPA: S41 family peptidase [Anaeromyxobacteraceae bacterium]|nr:S41 family peptidase [Anaeromyxobacteraceae bacterium]
MRRKRIALLVLVGLAFFAGLSLDHVARAARRDAGQPYRPLDVFADVLAFIENGYVEDVKEKDLVYGAIEGMVGRLDPHSQFMRPEVFRSLKEETSGEFDGVGLELAMKDDHLVVVSPIADAPAERAGLRAGDQILRIDGVVTKDLPFAEAVRRMKGLAGSKVTLEIMRVGFASPQSFTLVRDRVRTQSVEWRVLDKDRGQVLVRLKTFQERTDQAVKKALDGARAELGGEIRGLVLDLRNDPGGLFDQAVKVADRFLSEGIIVTTEGRDKKNVEVERARGKETEPPYPMIVLVNRGTASASEILAGALQDHGRAVIMGTQTFGKGSVQSVIDLEDGSGLKLTVARYYTPKHRSIQELGITPDVVVAEAPPAARVDEGPGEKDLERHFRNGSDEAPAAAEPSSVPADDYQLRTALDYLRAAAIFKAGAPAAAPTAAKR